MFRVDTTEEMSQTIGGFTYNYDRSINNEVELRVELIQKMTIKTQFKIRYPIVTTLPPPPPEPQNSVLVDIPFADVNKTDFLTACNAQYNNGTTCINVIEGPDGQTVVEFGGSQSAIDNTIADIHANGYKTPDTTLQLIPTQTPTTQPPQPHAEFVFLINAGTTSDYVGEETLSFTMEVKKCFYPF